MSRAHHRRLPKPLTNLSRARRQTNVRRHSPSDGP
jgi:hypothetical protein